MEVGMNESETPDDAVVINDTIPFPNVGQEEPPISDGAKLAALFEEDRQFGLSHRPILTSAFGGRTWLDDAPPEALVDAADSIILTHTARMAIRAVAKVENAWAMSDAADRRLAAVPYCEVMGTLIRDRDQAVDTYQRVREKLARTEHLESICTRGKTISFAKPRLPRAKQKKCAIA